MTGDIFVAKTSAAMLVDGQVHHIAEGRTLARAGHPIMAGREHMWEPLRVHYDLPADEAAPAAAPAAKTAAAARKTAAAKASGS